MKCRCFSISQSNTTVHLMFHPVFCPCSMAQAVANLLRFLFVILALFPAENPLPHEFPAYKSFLSLQAPTLIEHPSLNFLCCEQS